MLSRFQQVAGWLILLSFIGAGIVLRILGLGWGIPAALPPDATSYRSSFHFDEDSYLWGLTRVQAKSWNFDVQDLHWGTLQFYLIGGALKTAEAAGYLSQPWRDAFLKMDRVDFPKIYRSGRAVSAIAAILSLLVIFLTGMKIHNAEAGLVAAALLAVTPLHVVNAHYLTSDITMVLLVLTAFLFYSVSLESESRTPDVLSGFFLGLAISAKYNAVFILPLWPARDLFFRKTSWRAKVWTYAAVLIGFGLGEPYAFLRPRDFLKTIYDAHISNSGEVNQFLLTSAQLLLEQAKALVNYGLQWPIGVVSVLGVILCVRRPSRPRLCLLGAIVMMTVSLVAGRSPMIRYTLPIVPLLVLAAALVLTGPIAKQWRPWIYSIVMFFPLAYSWAQVATMMREHPANDAARWIETHVPEGSRIGQIWPELPLLDGRRYDLHYFRGVIDENEKDVRDFDRQFVILDNLPLRPLLPSFAQLLAREYDQVAEFRSEPRIGGWVISEPNAPHDWKYSHPVVRIYRRKSM